MSNYFRGYEIHQVGGVWYFSDTNELVNETWKQRPCGHCHRHNTPEGHDACLGTLDKVMNACCGHGMVKDAYVQFEDCSVINGKEAMDYFLDINLQSCYKF